MFLIEGNCNIKCFILKCLHGIFFLRFMDNLQTEVLEIEFLTYSKGMTTISEEDFAKILLRFTNVENISAYLENVRHCIPDEKVVVKIRVKLMFYYHYYYHYYCYFCIGCLLQWNFLL